MKTQGTSAIKRGFTLMELMVAMAITTIIITVLVSITSIALDTWNRSRSELRAARQAKSMIDTMSRDFESLVTRKGNTSEWLSAVVEPPTEMDKIGDSIKSTNASKLVFFTAATDRYNGQIGVSGTDMGGDVSCVAYQLKYRDPIDSSGTVKTFVLNRLLVDPDDTFNDLLGKTDATNAVKSLDNVFSGSTHGANLIKPENFACENIYQFSVTFHVQVTDATKTPPVFDMPVSIGQTNSDKVTKAFTIQGTGIKTDITDATVAAQVASGRVTAMEVSVTVLTDFGVEQLKRRTFSTDAQKAEFMAKNSYVYSKLVQLSSM
jgi:prepilin-type N-terminal cleavage/methylation domain-containing protein